MNNKLNNYYRIVSVDDSYQQTGKVYVKIQVIGKSHTFNQPVSELYQKDWLDNFSKEDVAHIAALYTAEHTKNLSLIEKFPKINTASKSSILIVSILFTACFILSNLTAFKLAEIRHFTFPAGLLFFPLTFVFDDILTEVYGFKISRRIIWMALLANTIIFLGTWFTISLPPSSYWHDQEAYTKVYQGSVRIFIASMISYLLGEFSNSIILAKLKVLTLGRYLWLRTIISTVIGVGIDTLCFIHIAFLFTMPYQDLWKIICIVCTFKIIYEVLATPITYKVSNYLKSKDKVDHYDFKTKFNPFSIAV